jgi:hypothetical protein
MAFAGVMGLMACAGSKPAKSPSATAASTRPASSEAKAAAEQEKKDEAQLICDYEKPTGSNIPEKVCRMREQIEADRDAAQREIHSTPSVQTIKGG